MSLVRVLVDCFADEQFSKIRSYFEQAGYASNPERLLIAALDASRHIGETFTIGLYLCSHLDHEELDLVCLLSNHITHNRYGRVAFNYRDAARRRLAELYCDNWKANAKGQRLRIERRSIFLKERWGEISASLQPHFNTIQQALKIKEESDSEGNLCAL